MSNINITRKTYFALGMLAAATSLVGGVLYVFGLYARLLFNISSFLSGAMMLMLGAAEGVKTLRGRLSFAAAALTVVSLMGGLLAKIGGALPWPCFAFPFWRESEEQSSLHTVSFLVLLAGGIQLAGSFIALPVRMRGFLSIAITLCQLMLCYLLYSAERDRRA